MLRFFLLTTVIVAVRASHLSYEGHGFASQPKLISQSVHLHEVPTKIIKVTKTVAIKVPVPYPVKVPHHIPVPVPVNHPVAVPVPQIVKVPHHVPVEVEKPVPVEVHHQVPVVVSKPVPLPQPVPVPHPVTITRPVFYPVPHPVPYPADGGHQDDGEGYNAEDHVGHESRSVEYGGQDLQAHQLQGQHVQQLNGHYDYHDGNGNGFQASQPDYTSHH